MEGYHPETRRQLPSAIHELQRILHDAGDARAAAIERMRRIFAEDDELGTRASAPPESAGSNGAPERLDAEAALASAIRQTIERSGVSFVFGEHLSDIWPATTELELSDRVGSLREFAAANGWDVYVMNGGHMAMFRTASMRQT